MMRKTRRRYVAVEFLDHCMNDGLDLKPITCKAVGVLVAQDRKAYYVASWLAGEEIDHNMESFTILKSAVTKMTTLKPGGRCVRRSSKSKKAKH